MNKSVYEAVAEAIVEIDEFDLQEMIEFDVFDHCDESANEEIRLLAEAENEILGAIERWNSEPDYGSPDWEPWPEVENITPISSFVNAMILYKDMRLTVLAKFPDGKQHYVFFGVTEVFEDVGDFGEWEESLVMDAIDKTLILADGSSSGNCRYRWNGLLWELNTDKPFATLSQPE